MNALVSRRTVMIGGAVAGTVFVSGAGLRWMGAVAPGAMVLSSLEMDIVEAVSEVLFSPGTFAVSGGDGVTSVEVDRLLADVMAPEVGKPFRTMLGALEWGTLISRGTRFSAMPVEGRKEVLDVWASENPTPRRRAFESLQAVLSMAFFRRPEVLERTGWRAGCLP